MEEIPRIENVLSEHPTFSGFYKHPSRDLWLTKNTDEVLEDDVINLAASGGEYKTFKKFHLHVLKLETFLQKPNEKITVYGNHIDGNKHNCEISNLEWGTPSDNLQHAFKTGLRSDNLPGVLCDLSTNKTIGFTSLKECAHYLGVHPAKITRYLKSNRQYPFNWKWSIWLLNESKPPLTSDDLCKCHNSTVRPFYLINVETGDKTLEFLYKHVIEKTGLSERNVSLLRNNPKETKAGWKIEEVLDADLIIDFLKNDPRVKERLKNNHLVRNSKEIKDTLQKIKVTNLITGEVTYFDDLIEFADKLSVYYHDVKFALLKSNVYRVYEINYLG